MGKVVLSKRLQMLANMAAPCRRVVDVGCDHGFLSVYLVQSGICSGALAMDVRRGPLANAEKHIAELGLGDYIETRLSDGLAEYSAGEADLLICAGMGGRLMERILTDGMEKARGLKALVLQPQSELGEFRAFLRREGFTVVGEDAVCEDGKYYFAMKAVPERRSSGGAGETVGESGACAGDACIMTGSTGCHGTVGESGAYAGDACIMTGSTGCHGTAGESTVCAGDACTAAERIGGPGGGKTEEPCSDLRLDDMYGAFLLKGRHPVLREYLEQRRAYLRSLGALLASKDTEKARVRCQELYRELEDVERALTGNFYSKGMN